MRARREHRAGDDDDHRKIDDDPGEGVEKEIEIRIAAPRRREGYGPRRRARRRREDGDDNQLVDCMSTQLASKRMMTRP